MKKPGRKKSEVEMVRYTVNLPKNVYEGMGTVAKKYSIDRSVLTRMILGCGIEQL